MFNSRILISQISPWLIWIAAHTGLLVQFNVELQPAMADAALFATLLFSGTLSITLILRTYRPDWRRSFAVLTWNGMLAFAVAWIYRWISTFLLQPGTRILDKTEHGFTLLIVLAFLVLTSSSLLNWLWFTLKEQEENEKWKADVEGMAREAELAGLRQQLQPHFLFNSLNSISALLNSDPAEARKMLQLLSDFLRGTVKKDPNIKISLKEELEQVELYFKIEQVRFGHRLKTSISITPEIETCTIPALLLQPLVENAIKFGLYGTTGEVLIAIIAAKEGNLIEISISNPYDQDASPKRGTGFGIRSVQRRLYLLYARNDLLQTTYENGTFLARIRVPQIPVMTI